MAPIGEASIGSGIKEKCLHCRLSETTQGDRRSVGLRGAAGLDVGMTRVPGTKKHDGQHGLGVRLGTRGMGSETCTWHERHGQ